MNKRKNDRKDREDRFARVNYRRIMEKLGIACTTYPFISIIFDGFVKQTGSLIKLRSKILTRRNASSFQLHGQLPRSADNFLGFWLTFDSAPAQRTLAMINGTRYDRFLRPMSSLPFPYAIFGLIKVLVFPFLRMKHHANFPIRKKKKKNRKTFEKIFIDRSKSESRSIRLYNVGYALNSRRSREREWKKRGKNRKIHVVKWLWEVNYCRCKKKKGGGGSDEIHERKGFLPRY